MNLKKLLKKSPFVVEQLSRYLYGFLPSGIQYGKIYREVYHFLEDSQWWTKKKQEDHQLQELQKLLNHVYQNVPYYRRVFDERGLLPRDIQSLNDLTKLPFLTKDLARKHAQELIARNIPKSELEIIRTSGSTGEPLAISFEKKKKDFVENAFIHMMWSRASYSSRHRRVNLTHELVDKVDTWWQYNPAHNLLTLSPYQMSEENLPNYVEKIRSFRPRVIKAIPSACMVLADFMKRRQLRPFPSVKLILLSSEMFYPWQREKMQDVFDARLFSLYGQSERVILAGECEVDSRYHVFPEYGITELVAADGRQIKRAGERGRLVGTGFTNYAMPLIRYKTDDLAVWSQKTCACQRSYPLIERIEGRDQEFIVLKNAQIVPLLAVPFSSILLDVKQFQFCQDTPGEIVLRLVRLPGFDEKSADRMIKDLFEGLGDLSVSLEFVEDIPRTKSGKHRYMIQKIPIRLGPSSSAA